MLVNKHPKHTRARQARPTLALLPGWNRVLTRTLALAVQCAKNGGTDRRVGVRWVDRGWGTGRGPVAGARGSVREERRDRFEGSGCGGLIAGGDGSGAGRWRSRVGARRRDRKGAGAVG